LFPWWALQLVELVLDLGRVPSARFPNGVSCALSGAPLDRGTLDTVVAAAGDFGGDNRAGLEATLHRISCIRNRAGSIVGLTCRVGRVSNSPHAYSHLLPSVWQNPRNKRL
jgi:stage III sporulation protein SpoIIIAA